MDVLPGAVVSQAQSPCAGVVTIDRLDAKSDQLGVAGTKPLRWRCHLRVQ